MIEAITHDVMQDEVLFRRVISNPEKFAEWWHRQDCTAWDTYYYVGPEWPRTVLARAHEAIARGREKRKTLDAA